MQKVDVVEEDAAEDVVVSDAPTNAVCSPTAFARPPSADVCSKESMRCTTSPWVVDVSKQG